LTVLLSCCTISRSSYKTVTVENEICSYSLEYSRYYKKAGPRIDRDPEPGWTSFKLLAPDKEEPMEYVQVPSGKMKTGTVSYTPAVISIFVVVADKPPEVDTSMKRLESTLKHATKFENFELLERSPVEVAGIEGEMIVYLVDNILPIIFKENLGRLEYHRVVYFDYNGLIWEMEAQCNQEMANQVNADFDHIVQTFKILD
jgi:hypothetical protein